MNDDMGIGGAIAVIVGGLIGVGMYFGFILLLLYIAVKVVLFALGYGFTLP